MIAALPIARGGQAGVKANAGWNGCTDSRTSGMRLFLCLAMLALAAAVEENPGLNPGIKELECVEVIVYSDHTVLRFRTTDELLKFLGQRFDLSVASAGKGRADGNEQTPPEKKTRRKERRST